MSNYGDRINSIIQKRNISKVELARKLSLSKQQLYTILKNKSLSSIDTLRELSNILDVPSDWLLQDFNKRFLVFAIDDYMSAIDENKAIEILNSLSLVFGEGENERNI